MIHPDGNIWMVVTGWPVPERVRSRAFQHIVFVEINWFRPYQATRRMADIRLDSPEADGPEPTHERTRFAGEPCG